MDFHQRSVLLVIDSSVTLVQIVDNRKTNLSVITKALQEAAKPAEHFSDVWSVFAPNYEKTVDIFTKGYLSGQEAAERWSILVQRVHYGKRLRA